MMFITHDLPEALRLGDRIAIMRDGAIVQLGTPEELVGSPADDYVENFMRDIPRSHVLTLRWIMRDPGPGDPTDGPRARRDHDDAATRVPVVAATEKPVRAVEDGQIVGIVDREADPPRDRGRRGRLTVARSLAAGSPRPAPRAPALALARAGRVQVARRSSRLMLVAYFALKGEYSWPASLDWNALPRKLDDFQTWLLDQRTAATRTSFFAIFDGFRVVPATGLVTGSIDLFDWMTWVGTIAAGDAARAALRRLARRR